MATGIDWLQTLLPGGVVAAVALGYQAYKSWREMRRKDEETLLERWKNELDRKTKQNEELEVELEESKHQTDRWRSRAGQMEHLLRRNGIDPPPVTLEGNRRGDSDDDDS